MTLELFVALLFVILFSVILEIITRCPILVASIVAIISLIVFAIFFETLTLTFIIWIIIGFTSSTMSSLNIKKLYGNKVFYISIISLYLLISFWLIDSYKVIEFLTKHYLAILTSIMIVLLLSKIKKN